MYDQIYVRVILNDLRRSYLDDDEEIYRLQMIQFFKIKDELGFHLNNDSLGSVH